MINLGDKNWGVKDSGLLAYKQVGSRFFNKDFDFSRASDGTYVGKDGLLKTASLYNLFTYSEDISGWLDVNNTTIISAKEFSFVAVGDRLQYGSVGSISGDYVFYADFDSADVGKSIKLSYYDNTAGSWNFGSDITIDSNGRAERLISTGTNVIGNIAFVASTSTPTQSYTLKHFQLNEGTEPLDYQYTNGRVGIPRIDFSDGVGALLLEPQSTNLVTYSEDYNQSSVWVKTGNTSINLNSIISPDGTQNASRITGLDGSGSNDLRYFPSGFNSANKTLTFSAYLKGSGTLRMQMSNGVNQGPSQTITLTSNWKRHSLTATFNSTTSSGFHINFDDLNGATATSYDLYGVQLEEKSYATSLINTSGSAVTRIADVANNCGTEQDFNSEEGVLYAEIATLANDGNNAISISDGTNGNRIYVGYNPLGRLDVNALSGGVVQCAFNYTGVSNPNTLNKIAFKYKENDFALWLNGVEVNTDNSGITPIGLDRLNFSTASVSVDNFYGKVRSVKYFPTALGDTELMTLTGGNGSLRGLFSAFTTRVLADGGTIEAETCVKNELKELL